MNRQLYDLGGAVDQARDFYTNNLGMDPQEANAVLSDAMASLNERTQPQSMMQMASNGGRIGYQMGGITSMPMDFGQPLQVPQQTSMPMQSMMSSPMANYGQTPLMMASGGIARLGYGFGNFVKGSGVAQPVSGGDTSGGGFGGMGLMGKLIRQNPQMFRPASNQQRLLNASSLNRDFIDLNENGIDDREEAAQGGRIGYQMGGEADMAQMGGMGMPQMNEQQALETIIQLLIQQGIDPETALQLAAQILQIFAQGGEPAVEAFANQLEQQEQMEAMAGGGIAGYAQRQGYGFGSFVSSAFKGITGAVKSVAKAVKSVAKSPIGRIALTIGANMLLPGAGTAFGAAMQAAAVNLGVQALGGGKINLLEAGLAGLGGYTSFGGPGLSGDPSTINQGGLTDAQLKTVGSTSNITSPVNIPLDKIQPVDIPADIGSYAENVQNITNQGITAKEFTNPLGTISDYQGIQQESPLSMSGPTVPKPGYFESVKAVAKDPSLSGIKYLATEGLSNIGTGVSEFVQKNPKTALAGAFATGLGTGIAFGAPQQPEESNDDFAKRQQDEANASITQFGRNLQIRNPFFYARYGAEDPFAVKAAQGGIMGYRKGYEKAGTVNKEEGIMQMASDPNPLADRDDLSRDLFGKPYIELTPLQQEQLNNYIEEKASKKSMGTKFAAVGGSMIPPARRIEGGVIELDARKTGGYIPYGKKERVDDVPAMLAKDEFVFTSRAVKGAGDGSARRGAAKMYKLMKQLEAKGKKMEQGARA